MLSKVTSILMLILVVVAETTASGQSFRHVIADDEQSNFFEIIEAAEAYFEDYIPDGEARYQDNEYIRFKRWQWYWQSRVTDDGRFPDLIAQHRTYQELQQSASRDETSPWVNINQTYGDGGYNGMGRTTAIAFHPTDPLTFFVGAPIGGIWKTTDGGQTYSALGDSLPYVSVGNICTHPTDPNIIYISIGDHNGWWNYGLGIYKSVDGGQTWQPTSNTSLFTQSVAYLRMVINPANPDEIFVAQTNGLFRTQDGGQSWDVVRSGSYRDVALMPGVDGALYCATDDYWGSSEVYASVDHGETWSQITDFNAQANYLQISVSPSEQGYLGIKSSVDGNTDYYATYDGGVNVNLMDMMPDDGVLFTSPQNANRIYCGFMVTHQSMNGGLDWDQLTDWYYTGERPEVHADNRFVAYHPLTNEIYFCNDGGIYRFNESTMEWTELTAGLIITQYYRIAVSQTDDTFMIGGTQDNGGRKRIGFDEWAATNGGDGMEVAINFEDDQIIYTTYTYGQLYRSYDQWNDDVYTEITPPGAGYGDWVAPYVLDPQDPSVVVAGYADVFRSDDHGETWQQISSDLTGDVSKKIKAIAVAPSDQYTIYAGRGSVLYITHDAGENWDTEIVVLGAGNSSEVSSITVHPTDAMKLWVTMSGYANTRKIFYSENGGVSFTNVSYNLPNVPCNASVLDRGSANYDLYVGTDVGVFVLDAAADNWIYYGAGLPNTMVSDLEIQYATRKLRIGTFGRGIWENDLYSAPGVPSTVPTMLTEGTAFHVLSNPVQDALKVDIHASQNMHGSWQIFNLQGQMLLEIPRTLATGHYQIQLDVRALASGNYILTHSSVNRNVEGVRFTKH